MELRRFDNRELMSQAATKYTTNLIKTHTDSGKVFTLGLSGGNSPTLYYELLAKETIDWSLVKILLVDDRKVEHTHPDSNAKMIHARLLSKIDIPQENIILPDTSIKSPSECAREYERRIKESLGSSTPKFNLLVLGVGPDGHTASLFPETDVNVDSDRFIISTIAPKPFKVADRISMTMDLINNAHMRIFVISGDGKEEIIQRTIEGDSRIPAGRIVDPCIIFKDSGSF